jgi:hypothetical protein
VVQGGGGASIAPTGRGPTLERTSLPMILALVRQARLERGTAARRQPNKRRASPVQRAPRSQLTRVSLTANSCGSVPASHVQNDGRMTVKRSWNPSGGPPTITLTWYFVWSYGDSNPRPLACHRKPSRFTGLQRAQWSQRQRPSRLRRRPAAVKKRGRLQDAVPGELSLSERPQSRASGLPVMLGP